MRTSWNTSKHVWKDDMVKRVVCDACRKQNGRRTTLEDGSRVCLTCLGNMMVKNKPRWIVAWPKEKGYDLSRVGGES